MQELRFVLIIVGALAIVALLFHGLWTSRKDGKAKFSNKPLGKLDDDDGSISTRSSSTRAFFPDADEHESEKKPRKEPAFSFDRPSSHESDPLEPLPIDPLIDGYGENIADEMDEVPSFSASKDFEGRSPSAPEVSDNIDDRAYLATTTIEQHEHITAEIDEAVESQDEELEVIVLNVHCAGKEAFVGTKLFDSMKQNGLLYGEMDIFHRHADLSGTGKVLFSVANMMHPGTLKHNDADTFTTKGISFFMTLPCFGDPEQNFKVMLRTAQQIADDMGGNVLDEKRNLMTPDRLAQYRNQIKEFKARIA
jgi:cell division protein ZipA